MAQVLLVSASPGAVCRPRGRLGPRPTRCVRAGPRVHPRPMGTGLLREGQLEQKRAQLAEKAAGTDGNFEERARQ